MNNEFLNKDLILVDKPVGWTSFDAVNFIRHQLRQATGDKKIKVGHAGTLDPFATGLLIVAVGRANTKKIDDFKNLTKTYLATIILGATSDTFDNTGTILNSDRANDPGLEKIKQTLEKFTGPQEQLPPMFSAKKINGQRLYKLARKGKEVERGPSSITIFEIKLIRYAYPELMIEITCSSGTYIRTLANDIGVAVGTGAYCDALRRVKIGNYSIEEALPIRKTDV